MKKFVLFLLLASPALAQDPRTEKSFEIGNLIGMAPAYDGANLRDNLASNAQNVLFDKDLGITRVDGYSRDNSVAFGSQPVLLWQFISSTGTEYMMAISSNLLMSSQGAGVYTTIVSTLNPNYVYDCVSALNRFTCTSTTGSFYLDGTVGTNGLLNIFDSTPTFPLGDKIIKHKNRLWVTGLPSAPSTLFGSGFLCGNCWVLGGNASDPVAYVFGINDGDSGTGMFSAFDKLYYGKSRSFWKLIGNSQNDFQQVNISPVIGVLQHHSMRDKQGNLYWLSFRGLEKLDGYSDVVSFPPFGDPIKNITDKIVAGYGFVKSKSVLDTTKSDFEAGVSSWVDTTDLPGSITISSPAVSQSTTPINSDPAQFPFVQWFGTNFQNGNRIAMSFYNKVESKVLQVNFSQEFFGTSNLGGYPPSSPNYTPKYRIFPAIFQDSGGNPGNLLFSGSTVAYDFDQASLLFTMASTMTTPTGATAVLSAGTTYWLGLMSSINPGSVFTGESFLIPVSTDPFVTNTNYLARTTNNAASWTIYPTTMPYFNLTMSSAQIFSSVKDLGPSVNSFARFAVSEVLNDGVVSFYTRAANDLVTLSTIAWLPQGVNTSLAPSPARYFQWRADFQVTTASQMPTVQDVALYWLDGFSKPNCASWVFDDRYWFSSSTNSNNTTTNETVVVADKFDNFTTLNGVNAYSFAEAFGSKFFGTSTSTGADTGMVFALSPSVLNQDGRPMDSFVETKDYCAGNCQSLDEWNKIYIRTRNSGTGGGALSTQYQFDRSGTYFSLGDVSLMEQTGLITSKVMFPFNGAGTTGYSVKFKFGNKQLNQPFVFLGASVYFNEREAD